MIDSRNINDLHPTVKRGCQELISRMAKLGYKVGISSTYRDVEKQNALYAQGRTKSGAVVTNARGGESIHNYRLAFDIFKNVVGGEWSDATFFKTAGKIWTDMGGEWGGNWKNFVDNPHFEFTGGLTLSQLKAGKQMTDIKMKWELEKKDMGVDEISNEQLTQLINSINQLKTSIESTNVAMNKIANANKKYNTTQEIPTWARPTIEKLVKQQAIVGDGTGLNLSEDVVKMLVILERTGVLEK